MTPSPSAPPSPPRGADRAATVKAVEARREQTPVDEAKPPDLKETFLSEIRKQKKFFYGTVVAQAQRIDIDGDKAIFVFGPQHRALRIQLEQHRPWLESTLSQLAGRRMTVTAAGFGETTSAPEKASAAVVPDRRQELKDRAMADTGVQTMLDVFAAEIKDIEEM